MTAPLDQSIIELLQRSRDDEATLRFPLPDAAFGFHAQQSAEKLLKALIGGHSERYEFIHDLDKLLEHTKRLGEDVPVPADLGVKLTRFAGIWRYQEPDPLSTDERVKLQEIIVTLRTFVMSRLTSLRSAVDWDAI